MLTLSLALPYQKKQLSSAVREPRPTPYPAAADRLSAIFSSGVFFCFC